MREIDLGRWVYVRTWQGELPNLQYPAGRTIETVVDAPLGPMAQPWCAAVETKIIRELTRYALLGACFRPDFGAPLRIRILESAEDGERFTDSLSRGHDDIHAGLRPVMVDDVLRGVLSSPELPKFGGGEIRFDCAAYGPNSTAPITVRTVARAVLLLLTLRDEPVPEERFRTILTARS
jgi:hypothetical protein